MSKRKYDQIEKDEEEVKFAKNCSEMINKSSREREQKTYKSDTKIINIKKQKLRQKAREAKRLQRIDESLEIKEERIEGDQDKRSRASEETNYEILDT